jgi:predicted nuclease with TOPRIM domain
LPRESRSARQIFDSQDADDAGRKKANKIATALHGKARTIRIVRLPSAKDVSEWLDLDIGNADKLEPAA